MSRPSGLSPADLVLVLRVFERYAGPAKATRRQVLDECKAAGVWLTPRKLRIAAQQLLEQGHSITTASGHGIASTPEEVDREDRAICAPARAAYERRDLLRRNETRDEERQVRERAEAKGQTTMELLQEGRA